MDIQLILSTFPSEQAAENIAEALIRSKLAACVQLINNLRSFYTWDEKLEKSSETLILVKTTVDKAEAVKDFILKQHSYEVPEIILIDAKSMNSDYSTWILEQVK